MKEIFLLVSLFFNLTVNSQVIAENEPPVRVKFLEASQLPTSITLHWSVLCFLKYANFIVERSKDGANYTTINNFQADNIRCRLPFDFEDKSVSGKVFYRVRVGDLDGNFSTSKVVAVFGKSKGFDIIGMSPTVITSIAQINISSASADKATLSVTSIYGQSVLKKSIALIKGSNTITLDLSSLSKGTFILSTYNSEGELKTIKFIKI